MLFVATLLLRLKAHHFEPDAFLINMPVLGFVSGLFIISVVAWFALPFAIRNSRHYQQKHLLFFIGGVGLLLRLMFLGTPAIMENDYNRYLWDGAVTAHGINPYAYSPDEIFKDAEPGELLYDLQEQSGPVFDRINHPEFSTVYPPISQAAFAISYLVSPFSLDGWRIVLLICEAGIFFLIVQILLQLGKSPIWSALYWLNPLVIKEAANSAHMEPVLMLPVMFAVWLALSRRYRLASIILAIAAGVKIWPMFLALPLWRPMLHAPRKLIVTMMLCGVLLVALLFPILLVGLSPKSGFVAFASQWNASSAIYLIILEAMDPLSNVLNIDNLPAPLLARATLGLALLSICISVCWQRATTPEKVVKRMFLITVAIYLLAPSHTPWYFLWIAPFLCVFPSRGLLLAGATLSLHYAYFHFMPRGFEETYQYGIVWLIWLPVWALLAFDLIRQRQMDAAHA
ncbi:MAG: glycosyltransferase 87 family protein [Rhizobiaceae bacterium]|nr:glycosyltransferase 87 family protein [Rhizobiaceae bacterium]